VTDKLYNYTMAEYTSFYQSSTMLLAVLDW